MYMQVSALYFMVPASLLPHLEDCLMAKFGIMDQCDSKIDLVKYMWVSDL